MSSCISRWLPQEGALYQQLLFNTKCVTLWRSRKDLSTRAWFLIFISSVVLLCLLSHELSYTSLVQIFSAVLTALHLIIRLLGFFGWVGGGGVHSSTVLSSWELLKVSVSLFHSCSIKISPTSPSQSSSETSIFSTIHRVFKLILSLL